MKVDQLFERISRRRNTKIEEKSSGFYVWSLFTNSYLSRHYPTREQAETAAIEHEQQMKK